MAYCYRISLSNTFQDELRIVDPLLSCDWNDGLGEWMIHRNPRVTQILGKTDAGVILEVRSMPFHILSITNTNLDTMDWRVIHRMHEIDLWKRYGSNLAQYHRDTEARVKEVNEGKKRKAREELDYRIKQNPAGIAAMRENWSAGRDMLEVPESLRTRKHFSYSGQGSRGYKDNFEKR